ncbi:MAG TPA: hypothetical protein VGQ42_11180 [Candidatus Dormibacteraeota bacterium]|jgi:hypothetical protein|nr:hypothetical protein [Candidatus Dormibacteraeota bacterium]
MTESTPATPELPPLPPLPDRVEPDALRDLDDEGLAAILEGVRGAERATVAAMSPYARQIKELQARVQEVATEQRRRERAAHIAQRKAVREQAAAGEMPTLEAALSDPVPPVPDDALLSSVRAFLATGGEVGFGYASRPGSLAFTDGRRQASATTLGEARRLYADGWEAGSPGVPGVRVHLAGTRVERVVPVDGVVIERVAQAS